MADTEGSGKAADAQIKAVDEADEAETVDQEDPKITLKRAVKAAESLVAKQKAHLEGAEQALADAKSALKEA